MSSLLNKARDKVEAVLDRNSNQADNPHSANAGPHSSNLMNKGDPRVDSDRDHRNDPTSRVGGLGNSQEYNTIHGQTTSPGVAGGIGGVEPGYGHTSGHTGGIAGHTTQHSAGHTELAGGVPGQGVGQTGGVHGQGLGHSGPTGDYAGQGTGHAVHTGGPGVATGGYAGAPNTYDNSQSANTGPHRSNLANKLDPRVDSDNDNRNDPTSRVGGYGGQGENYGHTTGTHATHGTHGTHGGVGTTAGYGGQGEHYGHSAGTHGTHGGVGTTAGYGSGTTTGVAGGHGQSSFTPGSGNAANTAGPHNSDMLNKLDPRVDADMDGSKTYGGNATYR